MTASRFTSRSCCRSRLARQGDGGGVCPLVASTSVRILALPGDGPRALRVVIYSRKSELERTLSIGSYSPVVTLLTSKIHGCPNRRRRCPETGASLRQAPPAIHLSGLAVRWPRCGNQYDPAASAVSWRGSGPSGAQPQRGGYRSRRNSGRCR